MVRQRFSHARAASQPTRTCVGCRERGTKDELVRLVAGSDADGHPAVVPDLVGGARGRGAHLHPSLACYELAVRRGSFARALRFRGDLTSTPVSAYLQSLVDADAGAPADTDRNWSSGS